MPEKIGFWKMIEKSRKSRVLFFCVSMVVIMAFYLPTLFMIKRSNEKELIEQQSAGMDFNILLDIESVQEKAGDLFIKGWVLRLDSKNISTRLLLKETDDTSTKVLYAKLEDRTDIRRYFGENYGLSGYNAKISTSELKEDVCYEIQWVLTYEQEQYSGEDKSLVTTIKKISTNYYLFNGEIYNYNPLEFTKPNVEGTEFETVIAKGMLHLYSHENRIWIYEFEDKLFYILDSTTLPSLDNRLSVPIAMYTSRSDLIPEAQKEQYLEGGYIRQEIYLSESHCVDGQPYFFVVVDLPTEYPVTYISSGLYANKDSAGWIYKGVFQRDLEIK